ncbi:MAG TPA: ATPase, T2SS/T4P/T4SS family [Guyparkeria sp.]|nr:ATPase, T2SS/T4P/T4SS family [Guyparkeria sp.]
MLVSRGRLGARDLERALVAQQEMGDLLGRVLVRLGLISEADLVEVLAEQLDVPRVVAADMPETPLMVEGVSTTFLSEHRIVPLQQTDEQLTVAMATPQDEFCRRGLALATGLEIVVRIATETEIDNQLQKLLTEDEAEDEGTSLLGAGVIDDEFVEHLKELATEAPVISLVNQVIARAVELGASDIHVEPGEEGVQIRYRVDGVLQSGNSPPPELGPAIASRIKLLAHMNIAERRLPQDGRIMTRVKGHELDLRISTVPTVHGESLVIRLLDRDSVRLDLEDMGFSERNLATFRDLLSQPHGILLVTGPTGSGKTTTLYAALSRLNDDTAKILTVEDPVEYQLAGINQIQVHSQIDLTFARALRSILRQDPDIIMIGEMRDTETAQIAVQSSLTGHLVLSTLHTNTAASAIVRLKDMGVEPYLITSTVTGVLGQRLVRRLCPACKREVELPAQLRETSGLNAIAGPDARVFEQVGCPECSHSGYRGRLAIHELFVMDSAMRQHVLDGMDAGALHEAARASGMRTLYEDGLRLVAAGDTTLDEVLRVSQD